MKKLKTNKGITLIALIITIIVLLILAAVAIAAIKGDGIISHAKNAKTEYTQSQTNEQDMLSQYVYELEKSNYELGTAMNIENYGKKVVGYKSKGEGLDTLVWRIFYQDDKNVYLISETSDKDYPVKNLSFYDNGVSLPTWTKKDIIEKYNNGADVSGYGKTLMPKANSLFTTSNTNANIIATAYLCDTTIWEMYTDAEGKASYAMGAPTLELFVKSYNASNLGYTEQLSFNEEKMGYNTSMPLGTLSTSQKNGIYCLNGDICLLASPVANSTDIGGTNSTYRIINVDVRFMGTGYGTRPIVSIPVSKFNYTLAD